MAAKVGLRVEVQGDDIVVILAGTSYVVKCAEQCVARAEHGARADDRSLRKRLLDHLFAASSSTDVRRP